MVVGVTAATVETERIEALVVALVQQSLSENPFSALVRASSAIPVWARMATVEPSNRKYRSPE